jgi:ankyrin repeat protein
MQPDLTDISHIYRFFSAMVHEDISAMQEAVDQGMAIDTLHPLRHTTALMESTRLGRTKAACWLLDHGASPGLLSGIRATSALHVAIRQRNASLTKQMLNLMERVNMLDHAGRSLMHLLVQYTEFKQQKNWLGIAETILQKSQRVDVLDDEGITELHYTLIHEWHALAELLLSYGANPNALALDTGVSPLHMAALNQQRAMVKLLLSYGANANIPASDGKTALQIMPEIAQLESEITHTPVIHVTLEALQPDHASLDKTK